MKFAQKGFTLIELVVVIVILGILAATAMPRLTNIDTEAKRANVQGHLAGLSSAAAIVYASQKSYVPLASIWANTTVTDQLFSIGSQTCTLGHSSGGSIINGYYYGAAGGINGASTLLASTVIDAALCSG